MFAKLIRPPSARKPTSQRGRTRNCPTNGSIDHDPAAQKLLGPVPDVPLAEPGDRCVDRDDERREARGLGARDGAERHVAAPAQIELVPARSAGGGPHLLEPRSRQRRENVHGAGGAGGSRRDRLSARIEQATAADRREENGEGELRPENARPQVGAPRHRRRAGPERDVVEDAAVLAQRHLSIGTAVDVVERHAGQSASGETPEVADVDNLRRGDRAGHRFLIEDSIPSRGTCGRGRASGSREGLAGATRSSWPSACLRRD